MIILMLDSQSFSIRMWARMPWGGLGLQPELPLGDGESGRGRWEGNRGRKGKEEGKGVKEGGTSVAALILI